MIINLGATNSNDNYTESPIPDSFYTQLDFPLKIATYTVLVFNHHVYSVISSIIDTFHQRTDLIIDISEIKSSTFASFGRTYKMYR